MTLVPHVRKIAVLRANAIGDFVMSLPAFEAVRATYPDAEIVLLGRQWHADFLHRRPGPIDRVEVIPCIPWLNTDGPENPQQRHAWFARMRAERFDIAMQLHGGGLHSNPFITMLDARVTVGMRTVDAPPLDRWVRYQYWQREALRYLEVASLVGARPVTLEPRLAVTRRDLAESAAFTGDFALIHPGAGDPRRRWPAEKFAQVGDALAARGLRVLVNGAGPEQAVADAVRGAMQAPSENPHLSLAGFVGLLSRCRVVVSNDSGPMHLAFAVGAPTVGIYWCGNVLNSGPSALRNTRPLASWNVHCPECGANTLEHRCDHAVSFVAEVPVQEVLEAALDLLPRPYGRVLIRDGRTWPTHATDPADIASDFPARARAGP